MENNEKNELNEEQLEKLEELKKKHERKIKRKNTKTWNVIHKTKIIKQECYNNLCIGYLALF